MVGMFCQASQQLYSVTILSLDRLGFVSATKDKLKDDKTHETNVIASRQSMLIGSDGHQIEACMHAILKCAPSFLINSNP